MKGCASHLLEIAGVIGGVKSVPQLAQWERDGAWDRSQSNLVGLTDVDKEDVLSASASDPPSGAHVIIIDIVTDSRRWAAG
jgi:hypothetical protein